jgi:parallel beta-helix repeat protein
VSLVPRGAQRASVERSRIFGVRSAVAAALLAGPVLLTGPALAPAVASSLTANVGLGVAGTAIQAASGSATAPATSITAATTARTASTAASFASANSQPATTTPPSGTFIATTGSDANPGTFAKPWKTLQHAANVAKGSVYLRAGTYSGGVTVSRSGITFSAYPGETATVSGGADGFHFSKVTSGGVKNLTVQYANSSMGAGVMVEASSNVTLNNLVLRYNKNYGVRTWYSTNTIIENSSIYKNQEGIRISYKANGTQILNNKIYSQDTMINDAVKDSGGGVGVTFLLSTGSVVARYNQLWLNRAKSRWYGYDGGAFEIYGASDVTMTDNVAWNNKDVLETGTSGLPCNNLTFTRNIGYAASTVKGYARGLILACASNSLFANNTLEGFDVSDVSVVNKLDYKFQGSLSGLKVENNVLRTNGVPVLYFDRLPSTVTVDYNLIWNASGGSLVYVVGKGSTSSFSTLKSWIGRMSHGIQGDPKFISLSGHDYRLAVGSAGVNHAAYLGSETSPYMGTAPDMGRWEMR